MLQSLPNVTRRWRMRRRVWGGRGDPRVSHTCRHTQAAKGEAGTLSAQVVALEARVAAAIAAGGALERAEARVATLNADNAALGARSASLEAENAGLRAKVNSVMSLLAGK